MGAISIARTSSRASNTPYFSRSLNKRALAPSQIYTLYLIELGLPPFLTMDTTLAESIEERIILNRAGVDFLH